MKKSILSLFTIFGLLVFTSCEDSVGPKISSDPGSPTLTSEVDGQSYELNEEDADEELLTLSWDAPDFGFSAPVEYIIEIDPEGSEFENPATFYETHETSVTMSVGEVNQRLISAGVPFGIESEVDFRIRAHVSDNVEDRLSDVFSIAFTPYEIVIEFPEIYVPGSYQSAGSYSEGDWSPETAPALYSTASDDSYEGYIYIADDGSMFKFTEDRSWDVNWGDDGADGTLQPDGADIEADAGYYKINVDLNDMTYSMLNTTWGVIGDAANGWDDGDDAEMSYDVEAKVWTVTTDLSEGEFKFRANGEWDLDYGSDNQDGTLQQGGGNINVTEAGTYTIELDLSGPIYRYSFELN